jgi:hypothetical protein
VGRPDVSRSSEAAIGGCRRLATGKQTAVHCSPTAARQRALAYDSTARDPDAAEVIGQPAA